MKVDIVAHGQKIGEVDIYASSWMAGIPRELQLDLDIAICRGEMELELRRKKKEE